MSQTSKAKKKQKSNVKKKNQERKGGHNKHGGQVRMQWDDLLKLIRTLSRESGLPIGAESNVVIKLFEEYAEDNAPFPPKQIVFSRPLDAEGNWLRVMATALVSKQCATYTQIFTSKTYSGLRALCLWGCDVGDVGAKHLAEIALPLLPHCCKLELIDCGLGVGACEALAMSLKNRRTTHLKILRLDHNGGIGARGVARLAEGLYFNSLLHTLSLAYCDIASDGGVFLQNILMTRDIGIKTLNLEGNHLERVGVMSFSQGLLGNRSLTSLNLSTNSFGGEGDALPGEIDAIKYLTAGLCAAKQLTNVNIDGNRVGAAGLGVLYAAAVEGMLHHVVELQFTPFAPCDTYKALVDKIEANRPVKTKKKKKRKSSKKK